MFLYLKCQLKWLTTLIKIQRTKFEKRLYDIREQTVCLFTVFLKNPRGKRDSPDNLFFFFFSFIAILDYMLAQCS